MSSRSSTSAATDYEIVKVDLTDGRDYPIYIGAGFSDEEGEFHGSVSHTSRLFFTTPSSCSLNISPPIIVISYIISHYIKLYFTIKASKILQSHVTGKQALLITNDRIAPMYLERYKSLLEQGGTIQVHTLVLPDGEENKSLEIMGMILDKALTVGLDRKATFVALGGGVIGDMVGFASAIYLRGINFIQVSDSECCCTCPSYYT